MNIDIGFLHIGMLKTASTYMQNSWLNDNSYCLSFKGNIEFLERLRDTVREDNLNKDIEVDISIDVRYQEGQKLVISNEGFSTAYINEVDFQHKIPKFIDYTSSVLGGLSSETENLLIVIREPISWIRSTFIQAIKQGWSRDAQNFVDIQHDFLKHSLNLKYIIECYERYFDNILILPFEILKEDEDEFWNIISKEFGVPMVEERRQKANVSLNLRRTFILSQLNEVAGLLSGTLRNSTDYTRDQEKNEILNNYPNLSKWTHRRFAEHANKDKLDRIYNLFNISEPPQNFLDFDLPKELIEVIRSKYINFLDKKVDKKYIDLYKQKLQEHILN